MKVKLAVPLDAEADTDLNLTPEFDTNFPNQCCGGTQGVFFS